MGKFAITPDEEKQLKSSDSTIPVPLASAIRPGYGIYHNPVTGREITHPTDQWHMRNRLRQGWKLGSASPELKAKWKIREAELRAENDRMEAAHATSKDHIKAEQDRFNEAVQTTVAAVLEKLNIDLPSTGVETPTPTPTSEVEPEGKQLSLFAPTGAPSESETKHVVSQAPSPALELVGHREEQT